MNQGSTLVRDVARFFFTNSTRQINICDRPYIFKGNFNYHKSVK